jgi:DNA-binding MarR family transcriptional regulator
MPYTSYRCFIRGQQRIWAGLPNREQHILEAVLKNPSNNRQKVQDILRLKELGSQATIHAALTRLKKMHLLIFTNDEGDGRVKLISLAPKAILILKSLGKLMTSCTKHQQLKRVT